MHYALVTVDISMQYMTHVVGLCVQHQESNEGMALPFVLVTVDISMQYMTHLVGLYVQHQERAGGTALPCAVCPGYC